MPVTNEPSPNISGLFQNLQERMKTLVFVFVFVLVDEQAISTKEAFLTRNGIEKTPYLRHNLYYKDTQDMTIIQTDLLGNNSPQLSKLKRQLVIFQFSASYFSIQYKGSFSDKKWYWTDS